jgi:flagellar hook-associated protein 1 FlgK
VSISSIMATGLSALNANQQALRATSTNVANVNTVGYARLDAQFQPRGGVQGGQGVDVDIVRVASVFLAASEMRAAAEMSSTSTVVEIMDRAQALLGDPNEPSSMFAALDPAFADFGAMALDPSSAMRRQEALSSLQALLTKVDTVSRELGALRRETHLRLDSALEEANTLMAAIARINRSIEGASVTGARATEAETERAKLIDRLSEIIDIKVQEKSLGGVEVRTSDGVLLVDNDPGRLAMDASANGQAFGSVAIFSPRSTTPIAADRHISGGEVKGFLEMRDRGLPDLQLAIGEFAGGLADAINAAHNASTAYPPPQSLTGGATGLIATDRLNFNGAANIGLVSATGELVRNFRIDFNAGTITDDGGGVTAFANSIGDFQMALNTALGASGTATFAAGSLTIASATAGVGVAVADDPAAPARRAGKGFAHAFALNDLVAKGAPLSYDTGLSGADLHGFAPGQTATFVLKDAQGAIVRTIGFQVAAGGSIASLRSEIDAALGGYARTQMDARGRLSIAPLAQDIARVDLFEDTTLRGDTGLSMSQLFGLGEAIPAARSVSLAVRQDIARNPPLLAAGRADLVGRTAGMRILSSGDGRGALALEEAGVATRLFQEAGGISAQETSVSAYAAKLAGHIAVRTEASENLKSAAVAYRDEIRTRRSNVEGVNLDEELVKMTTYQQAYAAASRMIQAARDMYDVVLQMV